MAGGLKLAPLLTEMKVDLTGFKKSMGDAAKIGTQEAEKIGKKMALASRAGESLSRVGATLTKGLTLPIIGAAVATTKMAVDFESSFAKVSTLLDNNVVDFGQYKNEILDASNESKIAVDEYSESVYQSISAGVDQTKAISFTTDAMKLAKGGFTDGAKAVDVLTTAINGYNLKSEDATRISDLLITTQNLGKTTVDELASSMGAVIPVANSVNFNIEELSAAYAQLTKNGIATAESGTYLKQMLSELGKSGSVADKALRELSGKGFADLKKEGVPTADILNMLGKYAEKDGKTLKDMFGSVEAGTAALVMAKGGGTEYNEMLAAMGTSAGATQEAFDKMDATPAEQLKGALNELRNAGIKFGGSFVPVIEKVSGVLTNAADAFSNLTDEQQQSVIKWGAVLAAIGPVTSVAGKTITTFTKVASAMKGVTATLGAAGGSSGIIGGLTGLAGVCAPVIAGVAAVGTGIYALHEHSQLMNRTVTESKEELSGMEKALALLTGTEVKSRKELEDLGLVHKEFSDDLSPEFQKAVEKSTEKVQDFSIFLNEIGFDKVITQEESYEFDQRVNDMCNEAINTITSKKDESQKALKALFVADDGAIDEGEQKVLDILSKSSDAQVAEVNGLKDEILAIKQRAFDEGRALNEQEIADIESKQARIRQIELEAVGGTQEEIAYAKNEFNARIQTMDAESASKLLQEKAKARDEEKINIQASYDTEIEMLKAKAQECTGEEKKALEDQAANLEADKQKKLESQNQLWDEYLGIIKRKNPKLLEAIDEFTGKEFTKKDMSCKKNLETYKAMYSGLDKITKSGTYKMYDTTAKAWADVTVVYDEKTKQITGVHSNMQLLTAGYSEKMASDAKKMASNTSGAYQQIVAASEYYVDKSGNVVHAASGVSYAMEDVKTKTDGTRQGIVNINGTPYNITVNKKGTIDALSEISRAADKAVETRTLNIMVKQNGKVKLPSELSYGDIVMGGGFFNGLDYVPYDGFYAKLHKGERVLTAEENQEYSAPQAGTSPEMVRSIIRSELKNIVIELNDREMGRAYSRYQERRS